HSSPHRPSLTSFFLLLPPPPRSTLFPYTTLFRSWHLIGPVAVISIAGIANLPRILRTEVLEVISQDYVRTARSKGLREKAVIARSEEHTSELQSRSDLVCRLLLEKKKKKTRTQTT